MKHVSGNKVVKEIGKGTVLGNEEDVVSSEYVIDGNRIGQFKFGTILNKNDLKTLRHPNRNDIFDKEYKEYCTRERIGNRDPKTERIGNRDPKTLKEYLGSHEHQKYQEREHREKIIKRTRPKKIAMTRIEVISEGIYKTDSSNNVIITWHNNDARLGHVWVRPG